VIPDSSSLKFSALVTEPCRHNSHNERTYHETDNHQDDLTVPTCFTKYLSLGHVLLVHIRASVNLHHTSPPPPLPRRTRIKNLCCHVACTTADSLKVSGTSRTAREMAGGPANLTRHLIRLHNMDPDATNEHQEQLQLRPAEVISLDESSGTPFRQGDTGTQQVSRGLRPLALGGQLCTESRLRSCSRGLHLLETLPHRALVWFIQVHPCAWCVFRGPQFLARLCPVLTRAVAAGLSKHSFRTAPEDTPFLQWIQPAMIWECAKHNTWTLHMGSFLPAATTAVMPPVTGHPTVAPAAHLRRDMLQSREQHTGYDYLPRDGNNLHDPAVIGDFPLAPAAHLRQGMVRPLEQHTGYGHITRGVNYRGLPTVTGPPHVAPAAHLRQDMLQHREQYTGYGNHPRDVNNQYKGCSDGRF
jgi:hypothetical protein